MLTWRPDAGLAILADGFWYVNGIAFEPDGGLVVIERFGLLRLDSSGGDEHEWVIENLGPGGGDGVCVDLDGRFSSERTADNVPARMIRRLFFSHSARPDFLSHDRVVLRLLNNSAIRRKSNRTGRECCKRQIKLNC